MSSIDSYVVEFIEFQDSEAGQQGALVAVPLFEIATDSNHPSPSGRFAGVVVCTLSLDVATQRFVASIKSSERGHALLLDDEGNALWAPDASLFGKNLLVESKGFPVFQGVLQTMSDGNSGTGEYSYYKFEESAGAFSRDKTEEKLIAFAPVHLGNVLWSVGVWAPKEDARQLIRSAYLVQLSVVGLSIITILLGSSYTLVTSLRTSRFLEQEVETKTGELQESHETLRWAMENLEASYAFQHAVIDGVSESIVVIGTDYRVKSMNRAARELSSSGGGTERSLLCCRIFHQRETPCTGTERPCPLAQVRETGRPVTMVREHIHTSGERRHLEIIASPLKGSDGAFQGVITSLRDITERKRAEEALQQYTERLRALTAQLAEVTEAERQQLARELHDQVGQNLTALGINLNIVRLQMPEKVGAAMSARLDDSLSLVEQTAECIRDVMADLRPPVLDDYGLVAALHWYGEQFSRRTDIAVAVVGDEPAPRLDTRVENVLFRVVQGALTNVAKHAQATHVTMTVEVEDGKLRLVIADDGIGFDLARLAKPVDGRGWGLLTMTERAEAVGASFCIESDPGQGAQVTVEVAL